MTRQMKDSGVEWLGEIPADWEVKRLKYLLECPMQYGANESGIEYNEALPRYIRITDIDNNNGLKVVNKLSLSEQMAEGYILNDNDILFARSGATVGKTFLYKSEYGRSAFAGYLIRAILDKKKVIPKFVFYYTLSEGYDLWKNYIFIQSTIQNIGADKYMNIVIPTTSIDEQQKIVDFLDEKVGEIDSVIAKTRETIEDYKKYKQAIITEAVTKGLNPDVEMKHSGIEWISEIPKEWNICKLKYLLKESMQYGANESGVIYNESLPRYIRITDIASDNKLKMNEKLSLTEEMANGFILEDGDILFARSGGTVGKSFIYKEHYGRCAFAGYLIRATMGEKLLPQYAYYFTLSNSYEAWKKRIFIQSTIQNIGADKYSNMEIIVPNTVNQQRDIIIYLDEKCSEIDKLIAKKEELLVDLENYKKSFIYEYVTGKKEVN